MRIGVSLRSAYDVEARTGATWMVERAAAADAAGLDWLFVGDHHATGPGTYYQNVPVMGRLLAEWGDRPAGALFLLPLWHPVLMAEQIGTLASLGRSRFVMQTAIGGGAAQFDAMGVSTRGRAARFEVALDMVRRLVAGDEVSDTEGASGYSFTAARISPIPPEPVDVWIAGSAPPAIERAARLGDGWLAAPTLVPPTAREQAATYLDARAALDRPPGEIAIRRDVHVDVDHTRAAAVAEPVIAGGYRGLPPAAFVWGEVERVADEFRDLAAMGYTAVIVRQIAADQRDAVRSIELLADVRALVADA